MINERGPLSNGVSTEPYRTKNSGIIFSKINDVDSTVYFRQCFRTCSCGSFETAGTMCILDELFNLKVYVPLHASTRVLGKMVTHKMCTHTSTVLTIVSALIVLFIFRCVSFAQINLSPQMRTPALTFD